MHLAPYTLKIEDYKKDGERAAARETEPNSKSFFISRAVRCFYDTESEICTQFRSVG